MNAKSSFLKICGRAALIVAGAAVIGLAFNAVSPRSLSLLKEPPKPPPRWPLISSDDALAAMKRGAIFVDSRDKEDFRAGHIARAVNLPVYDFDRQWKAFTAAWVPETELVIYCPSDDCEQAYKLAERLQQAGYSQMVVLNDGYLAWKAKKLPVATGE